PGGNECSFSPPRTRGSVRRCRRWLRPLLGHLGVWRDAQEELGTALDDQDIPGGTQAHGQALAARVPAGPAAVLVDAPAVQPDAPQVAAGVQKGLLRPLRVQVGDPLVDLGLAKPLVERQDEAALAFLFQPPPGRWPLFRQRPGRPAWALGPQIGDEA